MKVTFPCIIITIRTQTTSLNLGGMSFNILTINWFTHFAIWTIRVYFVFIQHGRLPTGSTEDLLEHDGAIYDSLDSLDNYVHKLCSCDNATGVVCSYKRYQDCTTATRGTPLACTLQTSNRRKRDIRKHQERALLMKSETRSQVIYI